MWLRDVKNNSRVKAKISRVSYHDYMLINESGQFFFNWEYESELSFDLYKLCLIDSKDEILGLMSLQDIRDELRIHINLIEISKNNIGKNKQYDRIAGCLLAHAVRLSFSRSYDGFISLLPKTVLIDHYCEKYGFEQFGRQLGLGYAASLNLIKTYL